MLSDNLSEWWLIFNQAHAGLQPACAWFLEITFMRIFACVCEYVHP